MSSMASTAEMCIAVGKVSLEDWLMLMSSLGWQKLLAGDLVAAVGNDLVGVHVGLSAGTGLPYHQGEMIVERSG